MTEAERTGLDHVVLPRRRPGLAILERHRPPRPTTSSTPSWPHSRRAATRPRSVGRNRLGRRDAPSRHGMRAVAADSSPFSQLAAIALLDAPGSRRCSTPRSPQLAGSRRVDVPLRQHIEELYASRCAACRRPIVVDQFIWPRDGDAAGRKIYRCAGCDASIGGAEERVAAGRRRRSRQARHRAEPSARRPRSPTRGGGAADRRRSA